MRLQEAQLDQAARHQRLSVRQWLEQVNQVGSAMLWQGTPVWVLDTEACQFLTDPGHHPVPPLADQPVLPSPPPARGVALLPLPMMLDGIDFPVHHLAWAAASTELGLVRFGGGQPQPQPLGIEAAGAEWPASDELVQHQVTLEQRWVDSAPQSPLVVPLLNLWYLIVESSVGVQVWDQGSPPVLHLAAAS